MKFIFLVSVWVSNADTVGVVTQRSVDMQGVASLLLVGQKISVS
jgi:hypothetical protein